MSLFGKRRVAFIPSSRRPGFFGIAVFSRADPGASLDVGCVASAVIGEVYDGDPLGAGGRRAVVDWRDHDGPARTNQRLAPAWSCGASSSIDVSSAYATL